MPDFDTNDLYRRIFDSVDFGLAVASADGVLLRVNDHLCALLGYDRDDLVGKHHSFLIAPADRNAVNRDVEALVRGGPPIFSASVRLAARSGSTLSAQAVYQRPRAAVAPPDFLTLIVRDAEKADSLLAHQKILLQELSHRTKNILTIVQVLARQIGRYAETADEFEAQFAPRLAAIAATHDVIAESSWTGADLAAIVRKQIRLFVQMSKARVHIDGPILAIRPSAAQNIGMALHELTANSCRFGALSDGKGRVDIAWRVAGERGADARFFMSWTESGGPKVAPPARSGFGNVVAKEMVAYALSGDVDYAFEESGVTWRLEAPLASVVGDVTGERVPKA